MAPLRHHGSVRPPFRGSAVPAATGTASWRTSPRGPGTPRAVSGPDRIYPGCLVGDNASKSLSWGGFVTRNGMSRTFTRRGAQSHSYLHLVRV